MRTRKVPEHVALAMHGSLRWARDASLSPLAGLQAGARAAAAAVTAALEAGVPTLTLYGAVPRRTAQGSTELRALAWSVIAAELEGRAAQLAQQGVLVKLLGEPEELPARVEQALARSAASLVGPPRLLLNLAVDLDGRGDLVGAARVLAAQVAAGRLLPEEIDLELLRGTLATATLRDPDLLIVTGGERRLVDFMIFESAYAEFSFSARRFPTFTAADFELAIADYLRRERRFGKTSEQVSPGLGLSATELSASY